MGKTVHFDSKEDHELFMKDFLSPSGIENSFKTWKVSGKYNTKDIIDINEFSKLINKANIDLLYTGHRFAEHINVLDDKNIWKNHAFDITELGDEVLDSIEENDILFMRGNYESKMEKLFDIIIERSKLIQQFY